LHNLSLFGIKVITFLRLRLCAILLWMMLVVWCVDHKIWMWYYYGPEKDWAFGRGITHKWNIGCKWIWFNFPFPKFNILLRHKGVILGLQGFSVVNIIVLNPDFTWVGDLAIKITHTCMYTRIQIWLNGICEVLHLPFFLVTMFLNFSPKSIYQGLCPKLTHLMHELAPKYLKTCQVESFVGSN
jgi:hypothetical protein